MPLQARFLYLLTEDDWDDQVILYLLEMLTGGRLDPVPLRLRRGGGIGEVRKKLPLMLARIREIGVQDGVACAISIDNDRALEHPTHETTRHTDLRTCRYCDVLTTVQQCLPAGVPIPSAVAVPVEMIEAWVLLMLDKNRYATEAELPRCGRCDQAVASRHYGANPPPQLKDLLAEECRAAGKTKGELALHGILRLDADDLAARSPSFALFRAQVVGWPKV